MNIDTKIDNTYTRCDRTRHKWLEAKRSVTLWYIWARCRDGACRSVPYRSCST